MVAWPWVGWALSLVVRRVVSGDAGRARWLSPMLGDARSNGAANDAAGAFVWAYDEEANIYSVELNGSIRF